MQPTEKMLSGCSSGTLVARGATRRGMLFTGTSGVLADQTQEIGGFCQGVWLKAQPHTHLKGPRVQVHKPYCGMLRDGTEGGENHESGLALETRTSVGWLLKGQGSTLAVGKLIRSAGWLRDPLVCVSGCEAA